MLELACENFHRELAHRRVILPHTRALAVELISNRPHGRVLPAPS